MTGVSKQLKDYIQAVLKSHSAQSIRGQLLSHGWPEEAINKAFSELKIPFESTKAQTQPQAQNQPQASSSSHLTQHAQHSQQTAEIQTPYDVVETLATYTVKSKSIPVTIFIQRVRGEFVPIYHAETTSISKNTQLIIEKIRQELIREVNIGMLDITDPNRATFAEDRFAETAQKMIEKAFPDASPDAISFMTAFLLERSLGLGSLEILRSDPDLEEIAINSASDPVWVYHRRFGWLKTNIKLESEAQIKHYAAMIGRKVGRQISILDPMMDANLVSGERFNATLMPISHFGNTITLRKFASKPWTITDFIASNAISLRAAAMIWEGVQYELSMLIVGGTASGKTSLLNVVSNFFPPNQRIISIEDTRELKLPAFLHWVPMTTRFPNNEGKGEIKMLDLLVNSLRMRPDRILVGEIRRKEEAEVLFEAIHTGHSVYATMHANDAHEAITRLTNPPISIPKHMLPAVSMILVQHRNRRTGKRRLFQLAEILPDASPNILMQLDVLSDALVPKNESKSYIKTLQLFTGITDAELQSHLAEKERVLNWLVKRNINTVDEIGRIVAEYYLNHDSLLKSIGQQ